MDWEILIIFCPKCYEALIDLDLKKLNPIKSQQTLFVCSSFDHTRFDSAWFYLFVD